MCEALYTVDWLDIMEPMDTQEAWEFFKTVFQDIIDKYVPITTGVQKKRNIYMSPEAFSLKKKKRKLWKSYTLSRTDHDYKAFKEARNKLRCLTQNLRIHHEQDIISNIRRNPKSFWRYINSHMKTRSGIDSIQRPDGSTATSDQEKAELLNSYFASVFTDENQVSFPSIESEVSVPKLEDIIITTSIVFNELNKLKTDKSPGPEGWPLHIFKECSEQLSTPPLSILFNKSFQSGVLPSEWRIAFVTPIHKKGSHHLASNYRPVSLTSTVVKVMESIIKTNVLEHLTSNNLLTCHQFGFLRGHSCTTQLLHVMEILTKSLNQGVPVDAIYMDLKKAFDTVAHKRLL